MKLIVSPKNGCCRIQFHDTDFFKSTNPQKTLHHFSYPKKTAGDVLLKYWLFKKGIIPSWFITIPIQYT